MKYTSRKRYNKVKNFRFDEKTLSLMQDNIAHYGRNITASEYIRELIRRDASEKVNGIKREDFIDMRRQLAGIGNNLNQIAHRMNLEIVNQYDIDEVKRAVSDVADIKEQINDIYILWEGK